LPMPSVIGLDARLSGDLVPEEFRGLDRFDARGKVVAALEASGELVSRKAHTVPLGLSERTGEPVEPLLSLQWFYDTDEAAARALAALDADRMRLTPERYTKVNRDWLGNLRHWCISRQLWWGHRVPAWYDADGNVYVPSPENPQLDPPDDPRYAGIELSQDPDVFDTWFSSSLWPFSTLGWPDESDPFFAKFYPTSVLVTGYDILFFWVARMQLAGLELVGEVPFHDVVLHGLINDEFGQKMSKSKGNGIDPLEVIEEHGADALRFALSRYSTGTQDISWDPRSVELGRNFVTKLWNAARLVMLPADAEGEQPGERRRQAGEGGKAAAGAKAGERSLADRWIQSRLQRAVAVVSGALDAYDLGAANRAAHEFVWSEFCDWYLEAAKAPLRAGDPVTRATVTSVLESVLKLLHPLMPFVTSEIHAALGHPLQLALESWPQHDAGLVDELAEADFGRLQAAVTAARNLRAEAELPPSRIIKLTVDGPAAPALLAERGLFESLARAELRAADEAAPGAGAVVAGAAGGGASLSRPLPDMELRLPLAGQVDLDAYEANQRARLAKVEAEGERSRKKLSNEKFVANAPAEVVAEERRRLVEAEDVARRIAAVLERLA
ncbi:MAG TPA: class I tRNA ligase family protein, partial [Trueperaceae bacterium]|nr:class I tRNA ligase family protein [Trueperaceae bacterium]